MRRQLEAGVVAGVIAGLAMAVAMMAYMGARDRSIWTNPNLIAAMWLGDNVADGNLTSATAIGFATHMATSAVMGAVAIPFIAALSPGRTILAAVSYALASYPVVFAAVLSWANPLMVARTELIPMTAAHAIFGVVLGTTYVLRQAAEPKDAPVWS